MSIVSSQPQFKPPGMVVMDGDGYTAKTPIPKGAKTELPADSLELSNKPAKASSKRILTSAILLIGGAMLGYGHKNQISKVLGAAKDKITQFASQGKVGEFVNRGKD